VFLGWFIMNNRYRHDRFIWFSFFQRWLNVHEVCSSCIFGRKLKARDIIYAIYVSHLHSRGYMKIVDVTACYCFEYTQALCSY
jgi:hypothetical protein